MPQVKRIGGPAGVLPSRHHPWEVGESRDLSDADAGYLCGTFPGCFSTEGTQPTAQVSAADSPLADRAVGSPKKPKMTLAGKAKAAVKRKPRTKK